MKITYDWIKDFLEVRQTPQKLAEKLTMAGLSVESLTPAGKDWVFDIEVTSNRPDCLSVRGLLREIAAVTNAKTKKNKFGDTHLIMSRQKEKRIRCASPISLSIRVDDKKGCRLYCGHLITGVKIGPSPEWLKKRLEAVGIRCVNNIVDITNYCCVEYGQPLHAFDFDKIKGASVVVRRARPEESLTLIDGTERKLSGDILVIADSQRPMAVAGVMGGLETEVSDGTQTVLLESACFDPVFVRRASRSLKVSSESSYRFERGVDLAGVSFTLGRATRMIMEICGGELITAKQAGSLKKERGLKIALPLKTAEEFLGISLKGSFVKDIFKKLGFQVKVKTEGVFEITVPSWRRDVRIPEDLMEEIARIYGYEKIPLTTFPVRPFFTEVQTRRLAEKVLRKVLVSTGLKEVVTYGLISEEDYQKCLMSLPEEILSLENFLSRDHRLLRTTLLPALMKCAALNIKRSNRNLEIFEVAGVFKRKEEVSLGILLSGARRASWKKEARAYTFYDLKGLLEVLLDEMQIQEYCLRPKSGGGGFFDKGCGFEMLVEGLVVASLGMVSEDCRRAWGMKGKEEIFCAELSVEALIQKAVLKKSFKPIVSTPSVFRDMSLAASAAAAYVKIEELIRRKAQGMVRSISLVESYQGREVADGMMGLTISSEYGGRDKTLTDAEVNSVHGGVLDHLAKELSVTFR